MSVNANDAPESNPLKIEVLKKKFENLGLGDLWGIITGYVIDGITDEDTIYGLLDSDPQAQSVISARFPSLRAAQQKDPSFDIKQYLATEDGFREILGNSGLPKGFYDSNSDFSKWIADGTSPAEIQSRIGTAAQAVGNADPNIRQALRDYYGVGDDGIAAFFLDPTKASDLLTAQYGAAAAGGAFKSQGMNLSKGLAEEIGNAGFQPGQSMQVAAQVAGETGNASRLSSIWGDDLTAEDLTRDSFNLAGGAEAGERKKRLASKERAAFSGSSAAQSGSLASRSSAGQI